MIITQQTSGFQPVKDITIEIKRHDYAVWYTATISIEFTDGAIQRTSISGENLAELIPTVRLCKQCNIELHEKELVALGSDYPMANDDVDELPF